MAALVFLLCLLLGAGLVASSRARRRRTTAAPWRRPRLLLVAILGLLALPVVASATTLQSLPPPPGENGPPNIGPAPSPRAIHHLPMKSATETFNSPFGSAKPLVAGEEGDRLLYHGGTVQYAPELDLLFWGSNFWSSEHYPVGLGEYLLSFYHGLKTESAWPSLQAGWQAILSQYHDAYEPGQYHDAVVAHEARVTSVFAPKNVTENLVKEEIDEWVGQGLTQGKNTQVVVLLAPNTKYAQNVACGYHSIDHQGYSYTVVPWAPDVETPATTCLTNTKEESEREHQGRVYNESTVIASHEFAESVTDPLLEEKCSWIENCSTTSEIADLCNGEQQLPGDTWWVNPLWDDEGGNKCSILDPPYPPANPPATTSESPTGVQNSSTERVSEATAIGTVNPNGLDTHYHFEYGMTKAYGDNTQSFDAGFGSRPAHVSALLERLEAGAQEYHYRLVASSWAGTTYGADEKFITPFLPPLVTTTTATEVGPTVATLRGTFYAGASEHPQENGERPEHPKVSTYFEYGTTAEYGTRTSTQEESGGGGAAREEASRNVTGLLPNTLYHYRMVSSTSGGTTRGNDSTFTTLPSPYALTEQPTGVALTEATLRGKVNPGGHSTTYQFEYWPTGKTNETKHVPAMPESAGSGTATFFVSQKITGLTGFAEYQYRVEATSSLGTNYGPTLSLSAWPAFVQQTTPNPPNTHEAYFNGIACSGTTACTGVGVGENTSQVHAALAERWNGTEWASQSVPAPSESTGTYLRGVSCPSSASCTAVGTAKGPEGTWPAIAMQWNGTSWALQTLAPSGHGISELTGVSCVATSECVAVGDYTNESDVGQTFAERWNGSSWSLMSTPDYTNNTNNELKSVSCTSATSCTATGEYAEREGAGGRPIVEHWNGSTWTLQSVPTPPGSEENALVSVSCASNTECIAVGNASSGGHTFYYPVADRWNGSEWTLLTLPRPTGAEEQAFLASVSCPAVNSCIAAGHYSIDGNLYHQPLVERWNGTEWTVAGAASPPASEPFAVSCSSPGACTMVGHYLNGTMVTMAQEALTLPVADTESATEISKTSATLTGAVIPQGLETSYHFEYGTTLSYGAKMPVPDASAGAGTTRVAASNAVTGLEPNTTYHYRLIATSPGGTTVGEDHTFKTITNTLPTAETEVAQGIGKNAATLAGTVGPRGAETTYHFEYGATLSYGTKIPAPDVSAGAGTNNVAVDKTITGLEASTTYHYRLVATNQAGTTDGQDHTFTTVTPQWSVQTTPNPEPTKNSFVNGVACASSTSCISVGEYGALPFAQKWSGTEWADQAVPNPTGSKGTQLLAIACSATTACTDVGYYINSAGAPVSLAERWNGSEWSIQSTPNPSGATKTLLQAVSCPTATTCFAGGYYVNAAGTLEMLAERWNGSEWSIQTIPSPGGSADSVTKGISCSSATACTSVGWYQTGTKVAIPFAERWNGTEWTAQTTPNPAEGKNSLLNGVSCATATSCFAVGNYEDTNTAGNYASQTDKWNGTEWVAQAVPVPLGVTSIVSTGVSCTSATSCASAGYYYGNNPGAEFTLADHWNGSEWLIETTPNPSPTRSLLTGVACYSTACIAVGNYLNIGSVFLTLAETSAK
jgi:hypothetical protein